MQVFNINIDMSSPNTNIPYEDEVTPGTSRQPQNADEHEHEDQNKNKDSGTESAGTSDDSSGNENRGKTEESPPRKRSRSSSSSESEDAVRKIERTVKRMNKKLKKLKEGSKKTKRTPPPPPVEAPLPEVLPLAPVISERPRKSRRIDTESVQSAFCPRLRPLSDTNQKPLRRATSEEPLRRVDNMPLRRASRVEQPLRRAQNTDDDVDDVESSEAPYDDAISLPDANADDTEWLDDEVPDEHVSPTPSEHPVDDEMEGLIGALDFVTSTESMGPDVNPAWAAKLNGIWLEENNLHSMKPLFDKYKVPANCDSVCAPLMNPEMKRVMTSKWDKKHDITYSGMQKTLTKVVAATLKLNELNMMKQDAQHKKQGLQITADVVAMLGHVSYELSNQRKFMLGKVIQPNFRPLCAKDTVKPTKLLFGENVTQLIKDVQVKNKIGYKDDAKSRLRSGGRPPFLGAWRGRPQGRAPRGKNYKGYQQQYLNNNNNNSTYQNQGHGKKKH